MRDTPNPALGFGPALIAAMFSAVSFGAPSLGQEVGRGETVMSRPRAEVEPLGIRAGGWVISPAVGIASQYDSNIRATDGGESADLILTIAPHLGVRSDWGRHEVRAHATGEIGRFSDSSRENYEDAELAVSGRLDIADHGALLASATVRHLHEGRASPDDTGGTEPTQFRQILSSIEARRRFSRLELRAEGGLVHYDFDDSESAAGPVNQDDRDRTELTALSEASYALTPDIFGFVRAAYVTVDYRQGQDDAGVDRESHGYRVELGGKVDITGLTQGSAYVGYLSRDFDDARLPTVDGATFGVNLTVNATPLTTVRVGGGRTIGETTVNTAAATFATSINASIDHELLRDVLIGGHAGYAELTFEGSPRTDKLTMAGAYIKYLINRTLTLGLDYDFSSRDSSAANSDFDVHRVTLRLTAAR